MEVNLNPLTGLNSRIAPVDFMGDQEAPAAIAEQEGTSGLRGPSLVVTDAPSSVALEELEYGNDNPVRDDDLGKLVKSAFDLKPPEVPNFI